VLPTPITVVAAAKAAVRATTLLFAKLIIDTPMIGVGHIHHAKMAALEHQDRTTNRTDVFTFALISQRNHVVGLLTHICS
jgi:hypothetical protein